MSHNSPDVVEPPAPNNVIYAAGGLVWRQTGQGREVAVVYRPGHGDWTLPKGKVKPEEDWEGAALREVKEETGLEAVIVRFAGCYSYEHGGRPKVVAVWHMLARGESHFVPSKEVESCAWLTVPQALEKLDHAREKELLRRHAGDEVTPPSRRVRWGQTRDRRRRRLAASVASFREVLSYRVKHRAEPDSAGEPPWASTASRLLDMAEETLGPGGGDVNEGWHYFFEAHRMGLHGLDADELAAQAESLRAEVEKKLSTSWRGVAALNLLTACEGREKQLANITRAMEIRDGSAANNYHRTDFVLGQMRVVAIYLFLILAAILLLVGLRFGGTLPLGWPDEAGGLGGLLLIFLFGMLGGALSTALTLVREPSRSPIPEQFLRNWITIIRPLIGGAAAIVVYLAYVALNGTLVEFKGSRGAFILALSIAAGFSERLVLSAMEKISTKA